MSDKITFVTGLWDIKRGESSEDFKRGFEEHYIPLLKELLKLDINLVIYCDSKVEEIVWQNREAKNTFVVKREVEYFKTNFDFYNKVSHIRNNQSWRDQAGWLGSSPQATLEYYNPIVMSKMFMLHDAVIMNPFNTENFFWIDAGLKNTVNLPEFFFPDNLEKLSTLTRRFLFLSFPYDGKVEVHGFEKNQMNQYAEEETTYVCRGGFFGGSSNMIKKYNGVYYDLLRATLDQGLMGTEESIFTLISYLYSYDIDRYSLEGNGLIGKFFHDLTHGQLKLEEKKEIKITKESIDVNLDEIRVYVLTFNSPEQLTLLLENWEKTVPELLNVKDKILINNSDCNDFDEKYQEIASKYNFIIEKFDNLGICGARQWVAEDFNESTNEYYLFFEDDMLFHTGNNVCSNGFSNKHNNFLKKALKIQKYENFDFLKLSFTEFFGDNTQQWSFCNIPSNVRKTYFGNLQLNFPRDYNKLPPIDVKYINSIDGLSYSCGDYYYCNWPLLFSKEGNKKIFLDTKWARPYEQTWMSQSFQLQKENKVKAGSLLLSPINHTRVYFYKAEARKES